MAVSWQGGRREEAGGEEGEGERKREKRGGRVLERWKVMFYWKMGKEEKG